MSGLTLVNRLQFPPTFQAMTLLIVPDRAGDLGSRPTVQLELHKGIRLVHQICAAKIPGLDFGEAQAA